MRRNLLLGALLPLFVVLGAAGGYLAADVGAAGSPGAAPAHDHAAVADAHEHAAVTDAHEHAAVTDAHEHAAVTDAHEHAAVTDAHEHNARLEPAAGPTTTAAGHHDMPGMGDMPAMGDTPGTDTGAAPAANGHTGGHDSAGTGVSATVRGTVVTVFAAINVAILAAAALVRRNLPTVRRRPGGLR
ncbi:hypothetical protein [Actinoplanes sp. NPDC049802]|uniref:hypothetical protein n=1 Tax=Actinoplanes sp. NPDC049802 TaxID=3154742 RepID=UPI0033D5F975